jgi:hypothetical protein
MLLKLFIYLSKDYVNYGRDSVGNHRNLGICYGVSRVDFDLAINLEIVNKGNHTF